MEIIKLVMGVFQTNTYILKENQHCLVIDPAGKAEKILEKIDEAQVDAILLTHGHFDHIKSVDDLYHIFKCPIYLRSEDFELVDPREAKIKNCIRNLTASISSPLTPLQERKYQIGPFSFETYFTSGHTEGSAIFVFDECIFAGDTLFKGSVGRTDLYGGDNRHLKQSLNIFKSFKKDYIIYPGHDEQTLLSEELLNNPYLR